MLVGTLPVAWFFAPFAATLLLTRFIGMKYLQRVPLPVVVELGLGAYAAGFFGLIGLGLVPVCGALFGLGYGVTLPCCVEWSTRLYPRNRRPVALVNASFQIRSIIALQTTGTALSAIGWQGVLTALGMPITIAFLIVVGHVAATYYWVRYWRASID